MARPLVDRGQVLHFSILTTPGAPVRLAAGNARKGSGVPIPCSISPGHCACRLQWVWDTRWRSSRLFLQFFRRGTINEPRTVAIQLFRSLRGDTLACIAESFGIGTYSTVSNILLRFQSRLQEEKALRKKMESLKKTILASQEQTW